MSAYPSRMSSPEINLNHAPSAVHQAAVPPPPPLAPRPPCRRPGVSFGRIVFFIVVLALAAVGIWRFTARGRRPVASQDIKPWIDLSQVEEEMRPVVEYLHPSPDEVTLLFETIRTSTYVQQKWATLANSIAFQYLPGHNKVNAGAAFIENDPARPVIVMFGGMVRMSRLIGAVSLVQASSEAQGVEKDPQAYLKRVSEAAFNSEGLSDNQVVDLLNEFEVGVAVFQDTAAVSSAKTVANGICKAVIGHEMGHLASGHPLGADPNMTISKNEESQADLFAGSVAASVENGQQMLLGQILEWYVLALGEVQNPTNEMFRTHPYSADRLRAAVQANKTLAASMGITPEMVDGLAAEASQVAVAAAAAKDASPDASSLNGRASADREAEDGAAEEAALDSTGAGAGR